MNNESKAEGRSPWNHFPSGRHLDLHGAPADSLELSWLALSLFLRTSLEGESLLINMPISPETK